MVPHKILRAAATAPLHETIMGLDPKKALA